MLASSFLKIKLNNVQLSKIELLDLQGKLVKEFPSDNLRLYLKDVENGTYFLQLTTRNHNRITKSGGNDYFESVIANPDLILKDLIKAAYPELLPDYSFTYIKELQ